MLKMENKKIKNKSTGMLVMAGLLVLLVVVAGVQTVQLFGLKKQLNTELTELQAVKPSASSSATSSGTDLKQSISNLPGMVGGC